MARPYYEIQVTIIDLNERRYSGNIELRREQILDATFPIIHLHATRLANSVADCIEDIEVSYVSH